MPFGSGGLPTIEQHMAMPGNDECADCEARRPEWASVNRGLAICGTCAEMHRMLDIRCTRVKSLVHDRWTQDEINLFCSKGGNNEANKRLAMEAGLSAPKPPPDTSRADMARYIDRKYSHSVAEDVWTPELEVIHAPPPQAPPPHALAMPVSQGSPAQGSMIVEVLGIEVLPDRVRDLRTFGPLFLNLSATLILGERISDLFSPSMGSATLKFNPPGRSEFPLDHPDRWLWCRVNDHGLFGDTQLACVGCIDTLEALSSDVQPVELRLELFAHDENNTNSHNGRGAVPGRFSQPGVPEPPGRHGPPGLEWAARAEENLENWYNGQCSGIAHMRLSFVDGLRPAPNNFPSRKSIAV